MGERKIWLTIQTVVGLGAIGLFFIIYGVELLPHHGPPVTVRWIREHLGQEALILINIAMVLAFLLLFRYRRPTKGVWSSRGVFIAFVIALMTEMFGWPLLLFLFAPLVDIPELTRNYFGFLGHWPAKVGTLFSLVGLVCIALGWQRIHRAQGLVTDGIYRWVRHPQYTGILLFITGWVLHWPTLITLILWPILVAAYVWLAQYEEKQLQEEFGDAYQAYARRVKRFIPYII